VKAIAAARAGGAVMLFTPEMCGLIDRDRTRARGNIRDEAQDVVLAAARARPPSMASGWRWVAGHRPGG
jgi:hypothetical protein